MTRLSHMNDSLCNPPMTHDEALSILALRVAQFEEAALHQTLHQHDPSPRPHETPFVATNAESWDFPAYPLVFSNTCLMCHEV